MKYLLTILCVCTLVSGCKKTEPEDLTEPVQINASQIWLSNESRTATILTVTSRGSWTVVAADEQLVIAPLSGDSGTTQVSINSTQDNETRAPKSFGEITIRHTATKRTYTINVLQRASKVEQTVLLYMPGRSLLTYYKNNIESVRKAITGAVPGNGRMLICYQPSSQTSASLYEVVSGESSTGDLVFVKNYTQFNASSVESLHQLFTDVEELAPANHYGCIIGSHGKAWIPVDAGVLTNYSVQSIQRLREEVDLWTPMPGALRTRSFGDSKYEIDIVDFATALNAQNYRFDYLIMDDCFMSSIETLYDLRQSVDYIVASPCEIMAAGFPYDRILPHLFSSDTTFDKLGKAAWEFWNFYQNDWDTITSNAQSGCITLTVTAELNALVEQTRLVNEASKQEFNLEELQSYEGMRTHVFYDLGHYVELSCADAGAVAGFKTQFDKTFPKRYNTPNFYSVYNAASNPINYYSGVTTSEPSTRYTAENKLTSWYIATH